MYKDDVRAARADRRCSSEDVQKRAARSVFEEADVASFRLCGTMGKESKRISMKARIAKSAPVR